MGKGFWTRPHSLPYFSGCGLARPEVTLRPAGWRACMRWLAWVWIVALVLVAHGLAGAAGSMAVARRITGTTKGCA